MLNITKQWKRRVTIAMFNSSLKPKRSIPRAPHCRRYALQYLSIKF